MQKATMKGVLGAGLRGAVFGLVIVAALDQTLTAWHDGALWRGLAALAVAVVFAVVMHRTVRAPRRSAVDTEPADPA